MIFFKKQWINFDASVRKRCFTQLKINNTSAHVTHTFVKTIILRFIQQKNQNIFKKKKNINIFKSFFEKTISRY